MFRSLARNKYTSDYNAIYKKYTQRSQVYTYQIIIEKDYHINFDIEHKRPLLLARSVYTYTYILEMGHVATEDLGCQWDLIGL